MYEEVGGGGGMEVGSAKCEVEERVGKGKWSMVFWLLVRIICHPIAVLEAPLVGNVGSVGIVPF